MVAPARAGRLLLVSVLVALTLATMLPRLVSAQFGLLDDGVTIHVARALGTAFEQGDPALLLRLELERGRFRPFYWVFGTLQHAVWGASPLGFFIGNALALLVTALCVSATVVTVSRDHLAGLLAGVAYVLSPPVIEAYYTLSKPEVPLALWLALSLWGWAAARGEAEGGRRGRLPFVVSAVALFAAYFTKETAQGMVLVSGAWVAGTWLTGRMAHTPGAARIDLWYLAANLAWAALFWVVRVGAGTAAVAAGGDSQRYAFTGASILSSALGHAVWYARDFPLLLPLVAFLVWRRGRGARPDPWLLVVPVLWILGWTAIMLPWPTIYEYYLLPAAIGVAIVVGTGVAEVVRTLSTPRALGKAVAVALVILMIVCVPLTLANTITNGRIQLAVDAANARVVDFLAATAPPAGRVLVHLPPTNEYVDELTLHLVLKGRADVRVQYRDDPAAHDGEPALIARPYVNNRPLPGVRLPVPDWGRGGSPDAGRGLLVHRVTHGLRLLAAPVPRSVCDLLVRSEAHAVLFCTGQRRFLDRRRFEYGWEVYRVDGY
jgi:hypothetical protein